MPCASYFWGEIMTSCHRFGVKSLHFRQMSFVELLKERNCPRSSSTHVLIVSPCKPFLSFHKHSALEHVAANNWFFNLLCNPFKMTSLEAYTSNTMSEVIEEIFKGQNKKDPGNHSPKSSLLILEMEKQTQRSHLIYPKAMKGNRSRIQSTVR